MWPPSKYPDGPCKECGGGSLTGVTLEALCGESLERSAGDLQRRPRDRLCGGPERSAHDPQMQKKLTQCGQGGKRGEESEEDEMTRESRSTETDLRKRGVFLTKHRLEIGMFPGRLKRSRNLH